jgi:N-acetylneuraminate lyase
MDNHDRLEGLIAAPHTPLSADNRVAFDQIDLQAEVLVAQGVSGVFVCGTTGEGPSLTTAERKSIAERWVRAAAGRLKVVIHVGHNALGEACELAAHAEKVGASATSSVGPNYFKPRDAEELTSFCAPLAAAAPGIPYYFYHSPGMTGVTVPMKPFLALAGGRIPNLAGIKFNHGDLFEYQQCLHFEGGRFDVPFGVDEALLAGVAVGAKGAVGSTYNYAAPLYLAMIAAFNRNDHATARQLAKTSLSLVEALIEFGVVASGKALMSLHGVECGAPRPPISPLSAAGRARLFERVRGLGLPFNNQANP